MTALTTHMTAGTHGPFARWPPVVALGLPLRPSMTSGWAAPALLRDLSGVGVILLMRLILVNFSICGEPS